MNTVTRTSTNVAQKPSVTRTVAAGVVAGVVFNVVGFLTFVLLGTGLDKTGPLLDPDLQSSKMIEVWTALEPLPMFEREPGLILGVYVLLGVIYALLFRSVAAAWPAGLVPRSARLALTVWALSCVFFELLGPWNLLGEPMALVLLELVFWAVMAMAAATVIVGISGRGGAAVRRIGDRVG